MGQLTSGPDPAPPRSDSKLLAACCARRRWTPTASPGRRRTSRRRSDLITRSDAPAGRTYAAAALRAGKPGVIARVHGSFIFPDTNAHGQGEQPHALYSVRFDAATLWGDSAEPRAPVHIDLWERYLQPASRQGAHHERRPRRPRSSPPRAGVGSLAPGPRARVAPRRRRSSRARPSTASSARTSRTSDRTTAQGRRAGVGRPAIGSGSSPTARRPSRSWASAASTSRSSRTRRASTTSSSARSAPAIRTRSSDFRPSGTSRSSTARGRCASRASSCTNSAWTCPRAPRSASGTRAPTRYLVLPSGRPAPSG